MQRLSGEKKRTIRNRYTAQPLKRIPFLGSNRLRASTPPRWTTTHFLYVFTWVQRVIGVERRKRLTSKRQHQWKRDTLPLDTRRQGFLLMRRHDLETKDRR